MVKFEIATVRSQLICPTNRPFVETRFIASLPKDMLKSIRLGFQSQAGNAVDADYLNYRN